MSRHWNPQDELARHERARPRKTWPNGATAGLFMVAGVCVGLSLVLYKVAGPREIVSRERAGE